MAKSFAETFEGLRGVLGYEPSERQVPVAVKSPDGAASTGATDIRRAAQGRQLSAEEARQLVNANGGGRR